MNNNATQPRHTFWPILVCYGSMTCMAITANLAPVYLTTFSEAFGGLTEEQLGRIAAVIFAATVLAILTTGPLADRWGGKLFAMLGLALTGVGLCLLAGARAYAMLLVANGIMGFAGGILDMVLSPIVCAMQPHQRGKALNWLHAFYCVGALGTILAASAAIHLGIHWRVLVLAMNAVPIALLLGFIPLRIPALVHEDAQRTPVATLLRQPILWAAVAGIALCGATEQGMSQWLPAYAERSLGYSKAVGGLALAGFSIGMIVGRVGVGSLAHWIRPLPLMLAGCFGCVLCYLVGCFVPCPPVELAACIVLGLTVSYLWPTTLGITADRFPHGGASMFSMMTAAGNAGCFVIPWLIGAVAQHTSLRWGMAVTTLCPALLGVIVLGMAPRKSGQRLR